MPFDTSRFMLSAPTLKECPEPDKPEICFGGRSNVGKSSLINALVNRKRLAFTSNTPGKTQTMNYYEVDDQFYLVDLPGYGYAKVPEKERKRWGKAIKEYLVTRETLQLVLHLVDARHNPTKLDEELFYFLGSNQLPFAVILTKSDKLSNNKRRNSEKNVRKVLEEMNIEVPIIASSSTNGLQIDDIKQLIQDFL